MANLTRISAPSFDGKNPSFDIEAGIAGEVVAAGDLVYLKSDGKWWIATGAALTAPAKAKGMVAVDASAGEACTVLFPGCRWNYGTGLTPGAQYFLGTAGLLADAATTGGTSVIAFAISATDIKFTDVQN